MQKRELEADCPGVSCPINTASASTRLQNSVLRPSRSPSGHKPRRAFLLSHASPAVLTATPATSRMSELRGFPLYLSLFCAAQEIFDPVSFPENRLLGPGHAGKLKSGMAESAVYRAWPRTLTRKILIHSEGVEIPAVQIFVGRDRKTPSLVVILNAETIYGIEVHDPSFKTAQGIGVGSSIGDLRKTKLRFEFSSQQGDGLFCNELRMKFAVDIDHATDRRLYEHEADPLPLIPPDVKIKWIWI
jgi:hypothetical protein